MLRMDIRTEGVWHHSLFGTPLLHHIFTQQNCCFLLYQYSKYHILNLQALTECKIDYEVKEWQTICNRLSHLSPLSELSCSQTAPNWAEPFWYRSCRGAEEMSLRFCLHGNFLKFFPEKLFVSDLFAVPLEIFAHSSTLFRSWKEPVTFRILEQTFWRFQHFTVCFCVCLQYFPEGAG